MSKKKWNAGMELVLTFKFITELLTEIKTLLIIRLHY